MMKWHPPLLYGVNHESLHKRTQSFAADCHARCECERSENRQADSAAWGALSHSLTIQPRVHLVALVGLKRASSCGDACRGRAAARYELRAEWQDALAVVRPPFAGSFGSGSPW